MHNDYHRTHPGFSVTCRFFLPNPKEARPYIRKSLEEDFDKKRCLQMAAEGLQASFSETKGILSIQTTTFQFKKESFISPLNVMLTQKLKFPFNYKLYIRQFDPIKQCYTVEAPSHPGRPIIIRSTSSWRRFCH